MISSRFVISAKSVQSGLVRYLALSGGSYRWEITQNFVHTFATFADARRAMDGPEFLPKLREEFSKIVTAAHNPRWGSIISEAVPATEPETIELTIHEMRPHEAFSVAVPA